MSGLLESWLAVEDFVERGGDVLLAIAGVTFVMWIMIVERVWYYRTVHARTVRRVCETWAARAETKSWHAHQIRRALIGEVSAGLDQSLGLIQALVALCPLLGLLGTVTGMIEVFDTMASTGSSNARAMASGVSKATIPTMAGMVAAIAGLYFSTWLQGYARREAERTADQLTQR